MWYEVVPTLLGRYKLPSSESSLNHEYLFYNTVPILAHNIQGGALLVWNA